MARLIGSPIVATLVACVCLYHLLVSADPTENLDEIVLDCERILLNVENGPTFSLMVNPNDTVQRLKLDLYEAMPFQKITPTVGNTSLDSEAKLYECIRAGTTVTLVMPQDQGLDTTEFVVRTRDGQEIQVATELFNSVSSLKNNITQWTGIAQAQQRLLLRGSELEDGLKLMDYAIVNGTKLDLGVPLENCRQTVTIYVKTLSAAMIEVEVNLADTVNGLKEKIWEKAGVPACVQRLSINERLIAGESHLCDLGLEAGSTVNMMLHSSQITHFDQVARLREPRAAKPNPYKVPIFHEAEDSGKSDQNDRQPASLYKDSRNWVTGNRRYDLELFDPIAPLAPNPDDETWIEEYRRRVVFASNPNANEFQRLEAGFDAARVKLSSAVRPYRLTANLTSKSYSRQQPSITLASEFTDASSDKPIPLGADVNNWAPDAFSDLDVMRLFEVVERVRQVLAKAAQTGKGILSLASQRRINRAILLTYLEALAGYAPPVVYEQSKEGEVCGICMDEPASEPAIRVACGHVFHADCILTWAVELMQGNRVPSCPLCRQRFMFPYDTLGKAELLWINEDELSN